MKRLFTILLLAIIILPSVDAQRRRTTSRGTSKRSTGTYRKNTSAAPGEFNGTFNVSFFGPGLGYLYGDIGGSADPKNFFGSTDWVIPQTKTYWGLAGDVILPSNFGVRGTFHVGNFDAEDLRSRNNGRMFSTSATVLEGTLQAMIIVLGGPSDIGSRHTAYVTLGAGYAYSMSSFNGDLSLRVQDAYRRIDLTGSNIWSTSIPFGGGYQFRLSDKWSVGFDVSYHYYLSDLMDGISTSYSRNSDVMFRSNVSVTYQIYGKECKTCSWSIAAKDKLRK
jgi:opacity protein-like surface antigen